MQIIVVFLSVFILAFSQKAERDPRLVGRWMMLFTKDASGEIIKDEFYKKKHIETYTKDGRWVPDPQIFIDDARKHGIDAQIDYAAIPTFQWKTINNELLEMNTDQGSRQNRYGFSGDTLVFGYSNGHTRYLLKRK
jgi:hypothetical protein